MTETSNAAALALANEEVQTILEKFDAPLMVKLEALNRVTKVAAELAWMQSASNANGTFAQIFLDLLKQLLPVLLPILLKLMFPTSPTAPPAAQGG